MLFVKFEKIELKKWFFSRAVFCDPTGDPSTVLSEFIG